MDEEKETMTESTSHILLQKGERERKEKMEKESTRASTRESSCIPLHRMGGSASLGTTREKVARVDATEFMHAAFAFQRLMLLLNIVGQQKVNSLLLEELTGGS